MQQCTSEDGKANEENDTGLRDQAEASSRKCGDAKIDGIELLSRSHRAPFVKLIELKSRAVV